MRAILTGVLLSGLSLFGTSLCQTVVAQSFVETLIPPPQPGFTPPPPAVWYGDVAWGDYDNDGDFDLFITGNRRSFDHPEPFTQLFLHNRDATTFIPNPPSEEPLRVPVGQYDDALSRNSAVLEDIWQSAVAWGDYDNDGDLDLLATGFNASGDLSLRLYQNIDDPERFALRFEAAGVSMGAVAWGDYDNDGDLDFVVCGTDAQGQPTTRLFENQTGIGGQFLRREVGLVGLANCSAEWGDYDNDGDLDLLMTGLAAPQAFITSIYRNDGNGAFAEAGAGLKGLLYASATWGDYDADGDLDILLNGAKLTPLIMEGQVKIYRNDGGVFTDRTMLVSTFENDVTLGRYQGAAAWGDYDNDGYLDFIITGMRDPTSSESGKFYHNDRNGQFTKASSELTVITVTLATIILQGGSFKGGLFGTALWSDYDNDNDLDLLYLGRIPTEGVVLQILRNERPLSNTVPTAPDGLQATPQGATVTLTWNAAFDVQTPAPGLSYNLRVGTTPGGIDVVSPMAVLATGYRLLARRGNAGHNTSWRLRALPTGTYYWSVQALDNSFKGSPFTAEGTFTIDG